MYWAEDEVDLAVSGLIVCGEKFEAQSLEVLLGGNFSNSSVIQMNWFRPKSHQPPESPPKLHLRYDNLSAGIGQGWTQ